MLIIAMTAMNTVQNVLTSVIKKIRSLYQYTRDESKPKDRDTIKYFESFFDTWRTLIPLVILADVYFLYYILHIQKSP